LSEQQKIAIQLSHNAISGQDDPEILRTLYGKILDVELKEYSGLDDKTLGLLEKFETVSMSEANLNFQTLSIVFLPDELKDAIAVFDEAMGQAKASACVLLTKRSQYDDWLDAQEAAASAHGIKNVSTAMSIVLQLAQRNLYQLSEAWENDPSEKRFVPIETAIGRSKIPVEAAKTIRKAVDRMVGRGDVPKDKMWQALQLLAEGYLRGE
ncbi:MAG: hypothetical protein FWD08_05515, partial [Alphaproteobacteria bacterium]|nr:hypothetical protein [Alphaproteobacteria bacterium]